MLAPSPRFLPFEFFFFNDTATTEIYTLSLHDALPISAALRGRFSFQPGSGARKLRTDRAVARRARRAPAAVGALQPRGRKLVRHHEPDQAADGVYPKLLSSCRRIPYDPGSAGLFRRQDSARHHAADSGSVWQRAIGVVIFRLDLSLAGGMAGRGRAARRIRDGDRQRRNAGARR